ncbi:uncharacterized protein BDCG_16530 [Blastomyces dermatitidis ER-3]|uniref:Uncharacterized protein n=2 Tax=Ajellomyces dermatitidis TaxID=5039 RepID=F2TPS7_AJEDA|nr:uncharacterized protein BDCG_16530 [Blastomyces dermatitidis ER-3]EGE85240.2 hypothetical protein BDDG_08185 [Blastomyces dermatitidis ATCC 18188]EQL31966.1 hypothetical protein BDFG_05762 [Blastomyces dermatitidis ATCC 26199]OAT00226.1 hypothetical protein BDCG_16530 [Blastomyces dermatitidis ER-3]
MEGEPGLAVWQEAKKATKKEIDQNGQGELEGGRQRALWGRGESQGRAKKHRRVVVGALDGMAMAMAMGMGMRGSRRGCLEGRFVLGRN